MSADGRGRKRRLGWSVRDSRGLVGTHVPSIHSFHKRPWGLGRPWAPRRAWRPDSKGTHGLLQESRDPVMGRSGRGCKEAHPAEGVEGSGRGPTAGIPLPWPESGGGRGGWGRRGPSLPLREAPETPLGGPGPEVGDLDGCSFLGARPMKAQGTHAQGRLCPAPCLQLPPAQASPSPLSPQGRWSRKGL